MSSSKGAEAAHYEQAGNGNDLSRQVTLQLTPEQYERLFFSPTPARGETQLAKRLGMSCRYLFRLDLSTNIMRSPDYYTTPLS